MYPLQWDRYPCRFLPVPLHCISCPPPPPPLDTRLLQSRLTCCQLTRYLLGCHAKYFSVVGVSVLCTLTLNLGPWHGRRFWPVKVFSWAVGYKLRSIYPSGTAEQWFCVWLIESKGILGRRILVWNAVHHNRTLKCRINEGFYSLILFIQE